MKKILSGNVFKLVLILMMTLMVSAFAGNVEDVEAKAVINKTSKKMIVGQKCKLKVKGTKKKVKWSSSKKKIATVSSKGKVKALKKGKAIITAKVGKKKMHCKITVEAPYISKKVSVIIAGAVDKINLEGNTQNVIWSSTNNSVATVSNGVIKAVAPGDATIKAVVGKKSYNCEIHVLDKKMKRIVEKIKALNDLVNDVREENNLNRLELDYDLCLVAEARAKELPKKFSHIRPNGMSCFTMFDEYSIEDYRVRGENIACGYTTPKKVLKAWMGSEGHRQQILNSKYKKTGIGIYYDKKSKQYYWAQVFYTKLE